MTEKYEVEARTVQAGELVAESVKEVQTGVELVNTIMTKVMRRDCHFGVIPGCPKPSLYLAGAEVLKKAFRLAVLIETTEVVLSGDHRKYVATATVSSAVTGTVLSKTTAECSTMEKKYRWRRAERKCPTCGKETIIKGKAEYGGGWICFAKKGGCGAKFADSAKEITEQPLGDVENTNLADCWQTCRMMAQKRAFVAGIRMTTGASELFTQDIEDGGPGAAQGEGGATQGADVAHQMRVEIGNMVLEMHDAKDAPAKIEEYSVYTDPKTKKVTAGIQSIRALDGVQLEMTLAKVREVYMKWLAAQHEKKDDPLAGKEGDGDADLLARASAALQEKAGKLGLKSAKSISAFITDEIKKAGGDEAGSLEDQAEAVLKKLAGE